MGRWTSQLRLFFLVTLSPSLLAILWVVLLSGCALKPNPKAATSSGSGYTSLAERQKSAVTSPAQPNPERAEPSAGIEWLRSYDEGLKRARAENRPVLLYFWASWCTWCRQMEAEVFPDAEVSAVIATKFVPVKVDIDRRENAMFLARYMVRGTPTFVVVNGQEEVLVGRGGKPSGYHLGAMEQEEFLEFLRAFVERSS